MSVDEAYELGARDALLSYLPRNIAEWTPEEQAAYEQGYEESRR